MTLRPPASGAVPRLADRSPVARGRLPPLHDGPHDGPKVVIGPPPAPWGILDGQNEAPRTPVPLLAGEPGSPVTLAPPTS
jgi:hypothetical protein